MYSELCECVKKLNNETERGALNWINYFLYSCKKILIFTVFNLYSILSKKKENNFFFLFLVMMYKFFIMFIL